MGWYADHVLPRMVDWGMRGEPFTAERRRCLAGLAGRVLELGFGSGLNLPCYPPEVEELLALDPAVVGRKLAAQRVAAAPFPVEHVGLDAEAIPLADASVDGVACTWTLCTIPDAARALAEVARVLRPGGALHFVEHGLSPRPRVARWQRRLDGLQAKLFGGCHLDRPIDALIAASPLELETVERFDMPGPPTHAHTFRGRATAPAAGRAGS